VSLPVLLVLVSAAARQEPLDRLARDALAQLDGVIAVPGLRDTVEILRDRWGVPHIYARHQDDLFFAQGFVHAQDRLWQMDMYRRIYEGRLAEVLGPDYVAHDRLMRLVQYRGPWDDREWSSYHPDGRRILQAFADGVNAYIAHLGERLPVEFRLTGLRPLGWTPQASVLRAQTALPLGDARAELLLAAEVVRYGVQEANRRANPSPYRDLVVPAGLDLALIPAAAAASLEGLRTGLPQPPLLPAYRDAADPRRGGGGDEAPIWPVTPPGGPAAEPPGSNNWVVSGRLTASGRVLLANDPHRNVSNPSLRYVVHLEAPGWSLIGATEPPLPGVMIGHNGRIAWGLTIVGTDQADVYVEEVHPENRNLVRFRDRWEPLRIVTDTIRVRGEAPVVVELKYSRHGPIFYEDTVHRKAYAIRSTMHEPGSAGYLSALRYHAVENCRAFLEVQRYYKAPSENMICGDAAGNIAWHASGAAPRRPNWHGRLPVPGSGAYEWDGFRTDLPQELNPERGWIATANHDIHPPDYDPPLFFKNGPQRGRFDRIAALLSEGSGFTRDDMIRMQHDALNWVAARDVSLFRGWTALDPDVEAARRMLAEWDGSQRRESTAAALYHYVTRQPIGLPAEARADTTAPAHRQRVLEDALRRGLERIRAAQGDDPREWRWGRIHKSEFPHPLIRAYDLPGVERSGGSGTVAATGATYRQIVDFAELDGSLATNVPGQSSQPGSPYYGNLIEAFGRGEYFPLSFTRAAVERHQAHRLLLVPKG
jgi:penicillin amidase